ncbi:T9SS C-terminal target domain-containing protein [Cyclobacteriaceae bacterium YHN15]|nr:T9SS C-terminal target domain-containing protein [Cyclobacteriaceae bacterium YHN15]
MQYKGISRVLLGFLVGFFCTLFNYSFVSAQCVECIEDYTYVLGSNDALTSPNNNPQLIRFVTGSDDTKYDWETNSPTTLRGVIVETGVYLTLGTRNNNSNREAFILEGADATNKGCVIVKSGATLDLAWISTMKNIDICVEEGGRIIFDSVDEEGGGSLRNLYTFDEVNIVLGGSDAILDFGNANIFINSTGGGLSISGWNLNSDDICINPTDDLPPSGERNSTGNIYWTEETSNICALLNLRVLPVEYLYFNPTLNRENRFVKLTWATAKEWENSHFEIERSVNGVNNWEKIGQKEGMGWSDMPVGYEFADEELPLVGGNVYYRLKQVDFDASFSYSKVVSVKVPSLQLTKGVWRVYPNPTNGEKFRIELLNAKEYNGENVQIRLVTPIAGDKTFVGSNINEVSNQLEDFFKRVNKGVYVLEIFWGQKLEYVKVLKD